MIRTRSSLQLVYWQAPQCRVEHEDPARDTHVLPTRAPISRRGKPRKWPSLQVNANP